MLKLNIKQNAMHSLHHAIEIMYESEMQEETRGRIYDEESHTVEWREDNHLFLSLADYTPPPSVYKLKFVLLHLIQAVELILKAYIVDLNPEAIFVSNKSKKKPKTISIISALDFIIKYEPNLIGEDEKNLIYKAKELRNDMEHHEFIFPKAELKQLCVDFLALCALLVQGLFSQSIFDWFEYDFLRDRPDPVASYLVNLLISTSNFGRATLMKTGMIWANKNPLEKTAFCIFCMQTTVISSRNICMGCGSEYEEDLLKII